MAMMTCGRAASAGNDDELFVGNRAAMAAAAVSATVADSSATWYNPAGLGAVERSQIDVSATAYTVRVYSTPRFLSTASGVSKDGSVVEFVTIPTQIAYVRRLAPGVSLGLGYFVPQASNFVLRETLDVGTASEGSQWQVAATVSNIQHTAVAALGLALSPRVRIGFSLVGGYAALTEAFTLFGALHQAGATTALSSRTAIGTSTRISIEAGAALQADLSSEFALGINLRSPRLRLYENTDSSASVASGMAIGSAVGLSAEAFEPKSSAGLELLRTGRAGVALAYRFESGWVAAEVDLQPALHRSQSNVDRDTLVNARIGFYRAVLPYVALGAGAFTDRAPDAVRAGLLFGAGDFYGGTAGVEFSNEHRLAPSEPVDSLVFSTVFAIRYAFSDGHFGRAVADPAALMAGAEPFQGAHGVLRTHEIGLYVGSGLQF
jgi:hypothetical protein